jgi:Ca2+/Na+ antiporter
MNPGLIGGLVGGGFGLLGGVIGTYASIKNTSGPRERAFMIRASIVGWIGVTMFLVGLMLLPRPFNFLLWLPYAIVLPLAILWCNRRQQAIRAEEAAASAAGPRPS